MYDPDKAKEEPSLPADTIFEGAIIELKDGKVEDFVKNTDKWKGDKAGPVINVVMEVLHKDKSFKFEQVFSYEENPDKVVVYSERSNLGKFKKKYGSLPKVGVKVKALTNDEGFLRLKLD